jgi:hypothetical protein
MRMVAAALLLLLPTTHAWVPSPLARTGPPFAPSSELLFRHKLSESDSEAPVKNRSTSSASGATAATTTTTTTTSEYLALDLISKLRYRQLRWEVESRQLDTTGTTSQLRTRLKEAIFPEDSDCLVSEDDGMTQDDCQVSVCVFAASVDLE